jgi:hypothetical protein
MNATHLHLMVNHIPVLGTIFGLLLLAAGTLRHSEELKRAAFLFFIAGALLALPAYLSGEPTVKATQGLPGVSPIVVQKHVEVAQLALSAVLVLGGLSASALWLFGKGTPVPRWFVLIVLVVALLASVLMAWTANLGGQVRHTEIRSEARNHLALHELKVEG